MEVGHRLLGLAINFVSPTLSFFALVISLFTLWFTVIRRGQLRSTHPSYIAICYDFVGRKFPQAKVFTRPLLYSTGKRGHVVDSLYLRVRTDDGRRAEFSFWGYGEQNQLVVGSGLSVPEGGISTNHHFNPVDHDELFLFTGGDYTLELVAKLVGRRRPKSLWTVTVNVPDGLFSTDRIQKSQVTFSWSPEQNRYLTTSGNRS